MPTVEAIVIGTDQLQEEAVAKLQAQMEGFEALVLARLQDFLRKFDTQDGKYVPGAKALALLNQIKKELDGVMQLKQAAAASKDFLANFDGIAKNIQAIHGEQNGIIVPESLVTPAKQYAMEATDFALRTAGVRLPFLEPVRKALFNHINFGAGVVETEKMLRALVIGDGKKNGALSQYVGQVAADAIHQYEGIVNTAIANEHGLTAVRYVNSLIATSRPQCVRWVKKEWITEAELAGEIAWAKENGSGMVPETDVATFKIYRGGYRCRHKAIPVRDEQARKMAATQPPNPAPPPSGSKEEVSPAKKAAKKAAKVDSALQAAQAETAARITKALALLDQLALADPQEPGTLEPPTRQVADDDIPDHVRPFVEQGAEDWKKITDQLHVETVQLSDVVSSQNIVFKPAVADYIRSGALVSSDNGGLPLAVEFNGTRYLVDGNHRVAAQLLLGESSASMRVLKLDEKGKVVKPTKGQAGQVVKPAPKKPRAPKPAPKPDPEAEAKKAAQLQAEKEAAKKAAWVELMKINTRMGALFVKATKLATDAEVYATTDADALAQAKADALQLVKEAQELVDSTDLPRFNLYHTSGAEPDPVLAEVLDTVQAAGLFKIPAILAPVKDAKFDGKAQGYADAAEKALAKVKGFALTVELLAKGTDQLKGPKAIKEAKSAAAQAAAEAELELQQLFTTLGVNKWQDVSDANATAKLRAKDVWEWVKGPIAANAAQIAALKYTAPPKKLTEKNAPPGWVDATGWKQIGGQAGSNVGAKYEAPDGSTWYVKQPQTEDHILNEVLAAKLYAAAGVGVPEVQVAKLGGKWGLASRIVNASALPSNKLAENADVQRGFVVDAWLGNWDVAGQSFDNVMVNHANGQAFRIDVGGSLRYRAKGGAKGAAWGKEAKEFDTLRHPDTNWQTSVLFEKIGTAEGAKSTFQEAKKLRDYVAGNSKQLRELVKLYGPRDAKIAAELLDTLKVRAQDVYLRAKKLAENGGDKPIAGGGMSTTGTVAKSAVNLESLKIAAKNTEDLKKELTTLQTEVIEVLDPKGSTWRVSKPQAEKVRAAIIEAEKSLQGTTDRRAKIAGQYGDFEARWRTKLEKYFGYSKERVAELEALKEYTASGHVKINEALYLPAAEAKALEYTIPNRNRITEALKNNRLEEATVVFRGISGPWANSIAALAPKLVGKFIRKPSFVSTSVLPEAGFSGPVRFRIMLPKGSAASYIDSVSYHTEREFELLIQRGATFQVLGQERVHGVAVIDLLLVGNAAF